MNRNGAGQNQIWLHRNQTRFDSWVPKAVGPTPCQGSTDFTSARSTRKTGTAWHSLKVSCRSVNRYELKNPSWTVPGSARENQANGQAQANGSATRPRPIQNQRAGAPKRKATTSPRPPSRHARYAGATGAM